MLAACDAGEVFALLEGGAGGAREASEALCALYGAVREPWLVRALLAYHARTGSARALDLLARAPEPHARFLLDALGEQLRAEPAARRQALAALAPLVARRPAWLHRLPPHPLPRELLRAARSERDPLPLLHALLALAALLPAAPALAAPHWPELADALLRPAALEPPPSPATRAHLQLAQLALFHALYATHPCTLLDTLRAELGAAAARDAWERSLQPLLHSVRLHPALVTGSRQREADAARRLEEHDVVAETRRLTLHTPERRGPDSPPAEPPAPALVGPPPAPGSGAAASRAAAALRPGADPWFALADRCGAESAPHTPLPAEADAGEPPEAAVEATPENTPAKETRAAFRFPADSSAVRAIGRRKETSPPAGAEPHSARLVRVLAERRSADSPVPFAGAAPPPGALRPEPRAPPPPDEPPGAEDREVRELTARAPAAAAWGEADGWAEPPDPRRGARPRDPAPRPGAPPARRASSCGPPAGRSACVAVQTVDTWPEPYEFLIADFYRSLPEDKPSGEARDPSLPCERLDAYLSDLCAGAARGGGGGGGGGELAEQLALAHAQLMYERWRREAHAERNRRLLGRCRQTRGLELQAAALRERLRAVSRERDELRARLERARAPAAAAAAAPALDREREIRLDAALQEERRCRVRAEAALAEAEAWRAAHAGELSAARAAAGEAARRVAALARAAAAAERRADHVRRLRRELLLLAEREARLTGAARAAAEGGAAGGGGAARARAGEERALRAAAARAEAEAGAAAARADAAAARAHELEAALAARDQVLGELKRGTRLAADEHAARVRALQDKYAALLRMFRAAEQRHLELLAAQGHAPRSPHTPPPSTAPTAPADH